MNDLSPLLLQVRNPDDVIRQHEIECFARGLGISPDRIRTFDLITDQPSDMMIKSADMILLGGSGDYAMTDDSPWIESCLDVMRRIHAFRIPTFASCFGFQAMARAHGGTVIHDKEHMEVGSYPITLTDAGKNDPIFGELDNPFIAQIGHQDRVSVLPTSAILLASSEKVTNHAFRFDDAPIYCTQFHPELDRNNIIKRLKAYPRYVEKFSGLPAHLFYETIKETPQTATILQRFVSHFLSN